MCAWLCGDIFRLSKAMRHTSVFTTLAYLSYKQEEIDRAILRHSQKALAA